jgi:hypothetical protein
MFNDLMTRGFVVIKNFLDSTDIQDLQNEYDFKKNLILNNNRYHWSDLTPAIKNKIYSVARKIVPTHVICMSMFFNNKKINFGWHQDHEIQYLWQSTQELNFWIPIIKQHPTQDGISLIDFEELKSHLSLEIYTQLLNGTAGGFKLLDNEHTLWHNESIWRDEVDQQKTVLPINFDQIAVTPEISPGDVLLLRGNVIHRTQEPITERTAVSVRCFPKNYVLSKEKFCSGPPIKQKYLKNLQYFSLPFNQRFDQDPYVTIEDMLDYLKKYSSI